MDSNFRLCGERDNRLHVLWEDAQHVFGKGRARTDGDWIDVLAVLPAAEHPSPASLDRLTHEYELKDELDGTWAARPLKLIRERGRTMLVLEDFGGEPLERLLGAPMEVGSFCRLAIGVAGALGKVHPVGSATPDVDRRLSRQRGRCLASADAQASGHQEH